MDITFQMAHDQIYIVMYTFLNFIKTIQCPCVPNLSTLIYDLVVYVRTVTNVISWIHAIKNTKL